MFSELFYPRLIIPHIYWRFEEDHHTKTWSIGIIVSTSSSWFYSIVFCVDVTITGPMSARLTHLHHTPNHYTYTTPPPPPYVYRTTEHRTPIIKNTFLTLASSRGLAVLVMPHAACPPDPPDMIQHNNKIWMITRCLGNASVSPPPPPVPSPRLCYRLDPPPRTTHV